MKHYKIVDLIRFLAAFCVLLHHALGLDCGRNMGSGISTVLGSLWFGPAAVIIFFVISGFCIHGPYVGKNEFDPNVFWARRYVRILIPLAAILPLGALVNVDYGPYTGFVTWSLLCELVYYTIYPLVRKLFGLVGWTRILVVAYAAGIGATWISQTYPAQTSLLFVRDVVSNFPAWILGCLLAEEAFGPAAARPKVPGKILAWRALALGASLTIGIAHYAGIFNLHWSLMPYALVVAAWLRAEISRDAPLGRFADLGNWSYSLYLVHPFAYFGVTPLLLAQFGLSRNRFLGICLALSISYLFYLAVEKPSHKLARILGKRLAAMPFTLREYF